VPNGFEIISSGLFNAFMGSDRRISCRASQVLSIFVGNVLALAILKALGQAEVNNVDIVTGTLRATDEKVIRFNISMNDALLVYGLDSFDHLRTN